MNKESGIGASGCDDALPMNNVRTVLTIRFLSPAKITIQTLYFYTRI